VGTQRVWAVAFGGSAKSSLLLANSSLGYSLQYGTSVAAAVACGILAATLSDQYLETERASAVSWLKQWVVVAKAGSQPSMPPFRAYDFVDRKRAIATHESRMSSLDISDGLKVGAGFLTYR
jgi:hypothetical protein